MPTGSIHTALLLAIHGQYNENLLKDEKVDYCTLSIVSNSI